MSSANQQSGGSSYQPPGQNSQYGSSKNKEDKTKDKLNMENQTNASDLKGILKRLGTKSLQSVTSLSEMEPLLASTPMSSDDRIDGRYISLTQMAERTNTFSPVSETNSMSSRIKNTGKQERMASYQYSSDESPTNYQVPVARRETAGPDSGIESTFSEAKQPNVRRGLVSQEDLDELEREEQQNAQSNSGYIGKDSKPLGAALGLKSSIQEYESPSSLLKNKYKHQANQKLKVQTTNKNDHLSNDVTRKISPLVLSEASPRNSEKKPDYKDIKINVKVDQLDGERIPGQTKDVEKNEEKTSMSEFLLGCSSPSAMLQKRIEKGMSGKQASSFGQSSQNDSPRQLKSLANESNNTDERPILSGYGQFSYTTPSKLMRKNEERGQSQNSSLSGGLGPGYGQFSYTTPSELIRKSKEAHRDGSPTPSSQSTGLEYRELSYTPRRLKSLANESNNTDERPILSGYAQFSYATPSELMRKNETRGQSQNSELSSGLGPGYGQFSYTTPSELIRKKEEADSHQDVLLSTTTSSVDRRSVNWDAQSDITVYFTQLSYLFHNAAMFAKSKSEPGFMRMFVESVASSLYETSLSDESGFEEVSTSQISVDPSTSEFLKKMRRHLENRLSYGSSGSTLFPNDSTTDAEMSEYSFGDESLYEDESEEERLARLSISATFNQLFWSLYAVDPKLALRTVGSDVYLLPPGLRRLAQSNQLYSPLVSSTGSGWTDLISSSDEDMEGKNEAQKRKFGAYQGISSAEFRNLQLEKEDLESQVRRLEVENSNLLSENKLIKQKFETASARINDLEEKLKVSQDELENLERNMNIEISEVCRKNRTEMEHHLEEQQSRLGSLHNENVAMKSEIVSLEKQMSSVKKEADYLRKTGDKKKALEAFMRESELLIQEVAKLKELLKESEEQVHGLTARNSESTNQLIQVSKVRDMLQQQLQTGGSMAQKQVIALEKRLKVTEERLQLEREDRGNNLSKTEEKLLSENARLSAMEKEYTRQLQREKDKNRSLEIKIREVKSKNEKLLLSMPIDDTIIGSSKSNYDIPFSIHSSNREEAKKVSYDINQILTQIEKENGLTFGQENEIIQYLWSQRETLLNHNRQWEITLEDLELADNDDVVAGLKSIRDMKNDFETRMRQMEEKIEDIRSEKQSLEKLYKDQLSSLTKERHTALGKLKTLNDMMDAIRSENEALRQSLQSNHSLDQEKLIDETETKRLSMEMLNLEDVVGELNRTVKQQTLELESVRAQLNSRNKALSDANAELALLTSRVSLDDSSVRKQQKIDRLTAQVSSLQTEMKKLTEKFGMQGAENSRLEQQLENANRQLLNIKTHNDTKANEKLEMKISFLQSELEQKDLHVEKVNRQYKKTETDLQQLRQELYYHQEHNNNLQSQVDNFRHQLDQKSNLLETITKSEKEKLNQMETLKDSLDTLSTQLNNKQIELQMSELELSQVKDVNDKLKSQIDQRDQSTPRPSLSATELHISQLQAEIEKLKSNLLQVSAFLNAREMEHQATQKELSKTRQYLADEKSKVVQITADKLELEHQKQAIGEERDVIFEEKALDEQDLVKLENKLQEVLHKFEEETFKQHDRNKYKNMDASNSQLMSEINSLTLLLDGKDKQVEIFQDKLHRNQIEVTFLHRRVEYLANENQCNKEDIDRLTNELIFKMKENSAIHEINMYLSKEKSYQEKEINVLQQDLKSEKNYIQKMKEEINTVLKKIDKTEIHQQAQVAELMAKDGKIASLETEKRQLENNIRQLENNLLQSRSKIDQFHEDISNLNNTRASLEQQLAAERSSLEAERSISSMKIDEVQKSNQKLEAVKHEQSFLLNNLTVERKNLHQLREEIVEKGQVENRLATQVDELKRENANLKHQISLNQKTIEHIKEEKAALVQEQYELNSMLKDKDRDISDLRERELMMNDNIRREVMVEKTALEQEKAAVARELQIARDEVNGMAEKLQQKDLQLNSFGRTLHEVEELNRKKQELDSKIEKLESTAADTRLLIDSQRTEVMSLRQENSKLQESFAKSQVNCHTLQDELRLIRESTTQQLNEVRNASAYQKDQNETEKFVLREALSKCEANLRTTETTLRSITENNVTLQNERKALEYSLNEVKSQLATEITERKLAQQREDNMKANVEEGKQNKFTVEERILEIQALVTKREGEITQQKDKVKRLIHQNQELEATAHVHDSTVRAKQDQIDTLQVEVSKLQQLLESQKQQLNSKLRKMILEQKTQRESQKQEMQNLSQQAMQLSVDLEQAREQIALKNKENLKLQEEILGLEEQKRDINSELRLSRDSLKSEEVMQSKLVTRFTEQEEEVKRLRTMWAKQAEESGDGDTKSMWKKMNQVIQDLSLQMQNNLDNQQRKEREAKDRETKVIQRYKKHNGELQSQLNTERALHQITKNSLHALEEDCARLRQLMHSVRRKSGSPDKRERSRIEEINEIITRSQTQAQSMLASGSFLDPSLKHISPVRDYNINSNHDGSRSPDTCSQLSDCSFGSAGGGGLNTSFVHMSGTFQPGSLTPRK